MKPPKALRSKPIAWGSRRCGMLGCVRPKKHSGLHRIKQLLCHICSLPIPWKAHSEARVYLKLSKDHVIPSSLLEPGAHNDVRPSHRVCNGTRGNTPIEQFDTTAVRKRVLKLLEQYHAELVVKPLPT